MLNIALKRQRPTLLRSEPPARVHARLRELLRSRALADHRFVGEGTIGPYLVDYVCYERSVIVQLEAPGGTGAAEPGPRTAFLAGMGYTVVQVSRRELFADPRRVLQRILAALR